jgi:hypothetical protein
LYVLRNTTVNDSQTELFLDGVGQRISIPPDSTWTYEVLVVARSQGNEFGVAQRAGFRLWGVINHDGSGVHVDKEFWEILYPLGSPWVASVAADNFRKAMTVMVVGAQNLPLRWVATVRTAEVMWPQ